MEIGSVSRLLARVAKWQTRWLQVPVFVRTWGFKSPLAHHGCLRRKRVDTHLLVYQVGAIRLVVDGVESSQHQ